MNQARIAVSSVFGLLAFALVALVGMPAQSVKAEHTSIPANATSVAICHNLQNNPHIVVVDPAGAEGHLHDGVGHEGDFVIGWVVGGIFMDNPADARTCPPGGNGGPINGGHVIIIPGFGGIILVPGFFVPDFELDIENELNNLNQNVNTNTSTNTNNNVNTNTQNQTNNQNTNVSTGDVNVKSTGGKGVGIGY